METPGIRNTLMDAVRHSRLLEYFSRLYHPVAHPDEDPQGEERVEWVRSLPFMGMHAMCLGVIFTGWSPVAVYTAIALYLVRIFSITAFYHRYFAHRSFETSRIAQFVFAVLGCSAVQKGPLWWAANHRHHHLYADTEQDLHSPSRQGFVWAHIGWITSARNRGTRFSYVKDWTRYPELVWINRFNLIVPTILAVSLFVTGTILSALAPGLNTSGPQMLVWGFFLSTVASSHATFSINSFAHMYGSQRYDTGNTSRNNWLLAILLLGEGWHNNHHHFPVSARNGFFWWEIDVTYALLRVLSWLRIIHGIRPVPEGVRDSGLIKGT